MTVISNSPRYDSALDTARLIGGNLKTIRERKRTLAYDLVCASVVEGFALSEAIESCKSALKWAKLASDERNQMNVLFTAVRVIDGAWKALPEETRKAFLTGEKIFSTLAKEIKDAEKARLQAEADAEDAGAGEGEGEGEGQPQGEAPEAPAMSDFAAACAFVAQTLTSGTLAEGDADAFLAMLDAVDAWKASEVERQSKAA